MLSIYELGLEGVHQRHDWLAGKMFFLVGSKACLIITGTGELNFFCRACMSIRLPAWDLQRRAMTSVLSPELQLLTGSKSSLFLTYLFLGDLRLQVPFLWALYYMNTLCRRYYTYSLLLLQTKFWTRPKWSNFNQDSSYCWSFHISKMSMTI